MKNRFFQELNEIDEVIGSDMSIADKEDAIVDLIVHYAENRRPVLMANDEDENTGQRVINLQHGHNDAGKLVTQWTMYTTDEIAFRTMMETGEILLYSTMDMNSAIEIAQELHVDQLHLRSTCGDILVDLEKISRCMRLKI